MKQTAGNPPIFTFYSYRRKKKSSGGRDEIILWAAAAHDDDAAAAAHTVPRTRWVMETTVEHTERSYSSSSPPSAPPDGPDAFPFPLPSSTLSHLLSVLLTLSLSPCILLTLYFKLSHAFFFSLSINLSRSLKVGLLEIFMSRSAFPFAKPHGSHTAINLTHTHRNRRIFCLPRLASRHCRVYVALMERPRQPITARQTDT